MGLLLSLSLSLSPLMKEQIWCFVQRERETDYFQVPAARQKHLTVSFVTLQQRKFSPALI